MDAVRTSELPFVTVIMPVRNEAAFIERSLSAVLAQNYPSDRMEILIADGMSSDGTREIVKGMMDGEPEVKNDVNVGAVWPRSPIVLVDNIGRVVPTGLNAALRLAKGDVIIRVDGHCEIAPTHVRRCVEHLEYEQVDGVGGRIIMVGDTFVSRTIAAAMSSAFGVGGSASRTGKNRSGLTDTIPFPAYTRSAISRAGLFDAELVRNQDDEYNYRLRKLGCKLLLAPDMQSRYYSRSSLRSLWWQYFQYGFWKVRVLQKHPRQMQPRPFVPVAFVAALLASCSLIWVTPLGWVLPMMVVGSYGLANGAATVYTSTQRGWQYLPLLPLVYAVLHLSYGLGFLVGLVKFANRWWDRKGNVSGLEDADTRAN